MLALCLAGSPASAVSEKIDSLTALLNTTHDQARVSVLLCISAEYRYSDYEMAIDFAGQALDLSKSINDTQGVISSLYELGRISISQGDKALAFSYFEEGLGKSLELSNEALIAEGGLRMSQYYSDTHDYAKALEYVGQSLEFYTSSKQRRRISSCLTTYGNIYKQMANYEQSLRYYFQALEIEESLNDLHGIALVLSDIGNIYLLTSRFQSARDYLIKALEMDQKNGDHEAIVTDLLNVGVAYQKLHDFDNAFLYFDSALVLARESKFKVIESILLGNIGSALKTQRRYKEALVYLFSALDRKRELKRYASAAHTCNNICDAYVQMGNLEEAKKFALEAIALSDDRDINQQKYAYSWMAECEYGLGNFKSAYDYLEKSNELKDSIFSAETTASMDELEIKYQTEKKEEEILLLTQAKAAAEFKRNVYIVAGVLTSFLLFLLYNSQRTRSKKDRQLLEKEKEIDRIKSRFFANISHEFRTPLTLILGPLDDLVTSVERGDIKNKLSVMQRNAGRLLDLVNQLLQLSRIESGKLNLNNVSADVIAVIKGVTMSFHSVAEQKNIDLNVNTDPERVVMNFDQEKLETILINLLSNAFKFTPANGKITIHGEITKGHRGAHKEFLKVVVSDNGKGIPGADVNLIFDRFYQSETNQLFQHEGSGIGLALTKELVELHHGVISAESKMGEGTQITFQIPLDLPLTANDQAHSHGVAKMLKDKTHLVLEETVDENEAVHTGLPLVLVIEDHEEVRHYIKETLITKYSVIVAHDGEDGVSKATELIPDLIISDVMMPKKGGYEVCHILKNDPRTSHVPIVLLTAKSDSEDRITGLMTKADDYITKPFVPRELLARVENLVASRKLLIEKYTTAGILKPKEIAVNSVDENFLNRILEILERQMSDERFGVEQLGVEIGMSRSQLHRKLTALLGHGPNQFIRSFRLQRAHDLLKQNAATATEIAYQVGFSSPAYFTKCFHEQFGYTPSKAQRS